MFERMLFTALVLLLFRFSEEYWECSDDSFTLVEGSDEVHCYLAVCDQLRWRQGAKTYCEENYDDASLPEPRTEDYYNDAFYPYLENVQNSEACESKFWLGMQYGDSAWRWASDAEALEYFDWAPDEPDGGDDFYVYVLVASDSTAGWYDIPDDCESEENCMTGTLCEVEPVWKDDEDVPIDIGDIVSNQNTIAYAVYFTTLPVLFSCFGICCVFSLCLGPVAMFYSCLFLGLGIAVIVIVIQLLPDVQVEPFSVTDVWVRDLDVSWWCDDGCTLGLDYTVHVTNNCAYDVEVTWIDLDVTKSGTDIADASLDPSDAATIPAGETADFVVEVDADLTALDMDMLWDMFWELLDTGTLEFDYAGTVSAVAMSFEVTVPYSGTLSDE